MIAYVLDEPAADDVGELLRRTDDAPRISAVNLAEVVDVLTRIYHRAPADIADALALLEAGGLLVVPVDADIGREAGALHARHYDRRERPLTLADCIALATAVRLGQGLATSDPPLATVAKGENVPLAVLPDSHGRRPPS